MYAFPNVNYGEMVIIFLEQGNVGMVKVGGKKAVEDAKSFIWKFMWM